MNSTLSPDITGSSIWNESDYTYVNETDYDGGYNPYDDNYSLWVDRSSLMYKVLCPIILIIGTTGNVLTVIVLTKMLSDASAFPLLFMALTFTDLLLLYLVLFFRWIAEQFGKWVIDQSEGACKFLTWMEYSLTSLSAWFLAAMTAQRAMTIVWPIQMRAMRPRRQAVVTIVILTACSFLFNSFVLDGMTTRDPTHADYCYWETTFKANIRPALGWLEILLNSLLPSAIMVVCNVLMIQAVKQSADRARSRNSAKKSGQNDIVYQITMTLIVVSLTFIVLTLPFYAMQIAAEFKADLDSDGSFHFWFNVTSILWATNSAINFFLYILTGSRFREEGMKLFRGTKTTVSQTHSTTDSSLKGTTSV